MVVAMNSVEYRVPEASQLSSEEVLLPVQDNNGSYNLAIRTAKSQGLMSSGSRGTRWYFYGTSDFRTKQIRFRQFK
jgi:hypothetical protein